MLISSATVIEHGQRSMSQSNSSQQATALPTLSQKEEKPIVFSRSYLDLLESNRDIKSQLYLAEQREERRSRVVSALQDEVALLNSITRELLRNAERIDSMEEMLIELSYQSEHNVEVLNMMQGLQYRDEKVVLTTKTKH